MSASGPRHSEKLSEKSVSSRNHGISCEPRTGRGSRPDMSGRRRRRFALGKTPGDSPPVGGTDCRDGDPESPVKAKQLALTLGSHTIPFFRCEEDMFIQRQMLSLHLPCDHQVYAKMTIYFVFVMAPVSFYGKRKGQVVGNLYPGNLKINDADSGRNKRKIRKILPLCFWILAVR